MKLRILGLHGMWSQKEVFNNFKEFFPLDKFEFLSIDINWDEFSPGNIAKEIQKISPDIIIAYSFGTYAIQKVFDLHGDYLKSVGRVILIGPIGPRGMGVWSFLKLILKNFSSYIKGVRRGVYEISDKEARKMGLNSKLIPETKKSVSMAFPFAGSVRKSISCAVLVVSGGKDVFVSVRDAAKVSRFHKADGLHFPFHGHDLLNGPVAKEIKNWINVKN